MEVGSLILGLSILQGSHGLFVATPRAPSPPFSPAPPLSAPEADPRGLHWTALPSAFWLDSANERSGRKWGPGVGGGGGQGTYFPCFRLPASLRTGCTPSLKV